MNKNANDSPLHSRTYGTLGPQVILLHGGPAAPGYMAPLARELASDFRVLEPFQRPSSDKPLTVARHVADLHQLVNSRCDSQLPAIVGHSWGAMLALAYAAEHSDSVSSLVLVGCGTFDQAARDRMQAVRNERIDPAMANRLDLLSEQFDDPDARLAAMGRLFQKLDSYDPIPTGNELARCDARAHEQTWQDMLRLQHQDIYPAAFATISAPVIMMHGTFDPHPGQMISASLKPYIPQLQYRQWPHCGHYPWLEKAARREFIIALRQWLLQNHNQ